MKPLKRALTIFTLGLFLPIFLAAQWEDKPLFPFAQAGKWGYMDRGGNIIVNAQYQQTYPFKYNRGRFKHKDKYGFVNSKGQVVIKAKYKSATNFSLNGSKVERSKKTFYIDTLGAVNKTWIMSCGYMPYEKCSKPTPLAPHKVIQNGSKFNLLLALEEDTSSHRNQIDTLPIAFDSIYSLHKNMVCFVKDGKIGLMDKFWLNEGSDYINKTLELVYDDYEVYPCQEETEAYENIIALKKDGLWAIVCLPNVAWFDSVVVNKQFGFKYKSIVSREDEYFIVEYRANAFGFVDTMGRKYFVD